MIIFGRNVILLNNCFYIEVYAVKNPSLEVTTIKNKEIINVNIWVNIIKAVKISISLVWD